ncbi:uncharacterized protein C8Q71DRAFT_81703 [Rhodofomes roseus]|uniref:Uncharacterized protein n=1 Tax=Rhodofomes roseus TaxID=34475 RepID=A0ABQ8KFV4_9APHY|nr:uncharacterized protein C8Q71DRAFT_81703 [Rhodofomes roseus]KAH9836393.1 hypothetical protein C8Q71DRAFT_81703 [Rhodofomes roseus]
MQREDRVRPRGCSSRWCVNETRRKWTMGRATRSAKCTYRPQIPHCVRSGRQDIEWAAYTPCDEEMKRAGAGRASSCFRDTRTPPWAVAWARRAGVAPQRPGRGDGLGCRLAPRGRARASAHCFAASIWQGAAPRSRLGQSPWRWRRAFAVAPRPWRCQRCPWMVPKFLRLGGRVFVLGGRAVDRDARCHSARQPVDNASPDHGLVTSVYNVTAVLSMCMCVRIRSPRPRCTGHGQRSGLSRCPGPPAQADWPAGSLAEQRPGSGGARMAGARGLARRSNGGAGRVAGRHGDARRKGSLMSSPARPHSSVSLHPASSLLAINLLVTMIPR